MDLAITIGQGLGFGVACGLSTIALLVPLFWPGIDARALGILGAAGPRPRRRRPLAAAERAHRCCASRRAPLPASSGCTTTSPGRASPIGGAGAAVMAVAAVPLAESAARAGSRPATALISAVAALIVGAGGARAVRRLSARAGRHLPGAAHPPSRRRALPGIADPALMQHRARNVAPLRARACWGTARSASSSSSASSARPASSSTSSVFAFCLRVLDVHYRLAYVIAFCVAVTNNFVWNRVWTFRHQRDDSHVAMQGARFFAVSLLAAAAGLRAARGCSCAPACPRSRPRCSPSRSSCRSRSSATSTGRSASGVMTAQPPSWPRCSCSSRCPRVARADVSAQRGDRDRQAAARGPHAAALAPRRALHARSARAANWLVLARAGLPARRRSRAGSIDRASGAISGQSPTESIRRLEDTAAIRIALRDPKVADWVRRYKAHTQYATYDPTFHTWTVHVNAGAALRRDRAGRDRRPHGQGACTPGRGRR